MKTGNRSNSLLVELLIVLLFFMLSSTILLRLFAAARMQSAKAELLSQAAASAQNIAEQLYHTQEPEELLTSLGFSRDPEQDIWILSEPSWQTEVSLSEEAAGTGIWRRQVVTIHSQDEVLLSLPCSVYEG